MDGPGRRLTGLRPLFQSQLKAMRAELGMFADATHRTIAFFEAPPPS